MQPDLDQLAEWAEIGPPWLFPTIAITLAVAVLAVLVTVITLALGAIRNSEFEAKFNFGFTAVQTVVTVGIFHGLYECFRRRLDAPPVESAALAIVFEGAGWVTIGLIKKHGSTSEEKQRPDGTTELVPSTGWGLGRWFFWGFACLNGFLAALGSQTREVMWVRIAMAVTGTLLWVLRLMLATRKPERAESEYVWSRDRIAYLLRIRRPRSDQKFDRNHEWTVTCLAAAIRRSNNRWGPERDGHGKWRTPLAVLAARTVRTTASTTPPEMLRDARRRAAEAYVFTQHARYDSAIMKAAIETAERAALADAARRADDAAVDDVGPPPGPDQVVGDSVPPTDPPDQPAAAVDDQAPGVGRVDEQVQRDREAVAAIAVATQKLAKVNCDTWDQVRETIAGHQLLNRVARESGVTKPRIKRVLPRAEALLPDVPHIDLTKNDTDRPDADAQPVDDATLLPSDSDGDRVPGQPDLIVAARPAA